MRRWRRVVAAGAGRRSVVPRRCLASATRRGHGLVAVAAQETGAKARRRFLFEGAAAGSEATVQVDDQALSEEQRRALPQSHAPARDTKRRMGDALHHLLLRHFLPRNYPRSVRPNYARYVRLQFAQSTLSSMGGVLSTQSLLFAVGLGASTALPAAAALNWVIKDGFGQLGGVVFASFISNKFDANPKMWRVWSVSFVVVATTVEILTPLVPHLFVPLASLANMCKNVSWLSSSATKASIHKSFLLAENLADLTAKAGSQGIAASLLGTAGGIALSTLVGADTFAVLGAYSVIGTAYMLINHRALRHVSLPTLNDQRAELALLAHARARADGAPAADAPPVPTPDQVGAREQYLVPFRSELDRSSRLRLGGAALADVCPAAGDLARLAALHSRERYMLRVLPGGPPTVAVLLDESASDRDVLDAYVHATAARLRLEAEPGAAATQADADRLGTETLEWARARRGEVRDALRGAGWQVEHSFLEAKRTRVSLVRGWPPQGRPPAAAAPPPPAPP